MTSAGCAPIPEHGGRSNSGRKIVAAVVPFVTAWRVDKTFDYLVPNELAGSLTTGSLVRVPFGGRRVRGIVTGVTEVPGDVEPQRRLLPVKAVVVEQSVCPPPLISLARWMAARYVVPLAAVMQRFEPPGVRAPARPAIALSPRPSSSLLERYEGGAALLHAIESQAPGTWSLRTLPGQDHSELIADLVAAAGRAGRGAAIVAVPEVRYGSEVIESLGIQAARVDTSRPARERAAAWLALASGHGLGAGGRAAVLAPSPELALLVVDEEAHRSYRSDRSPRYDARRVAVERARLQGAVCVLIDSSPTLETGYAAAAGAVGLVAPPRDAERAARPIVELVDAPHERSLSHELHQRIKETLATGDSVALLVPRSGFARSLWCAACRRSLRCPRCEAGLAYDRSARRVRCPRCGLARPAPDACPACGASEWRYLGAGSERLADQVARSFPRAHVVRMDPEVLAQEGPSTAPADIYVTTWIGTKTAIRPAVSLVGVLDADALIRRPDFRAAENAHQALAAMAEWAGPASRGGRIVIQCADHGHHAVQAVARGDYRFWLRRELEHRRELGYPPYSELVKVTAFGERRESLAESAAGACRAAGGTVLGPIPLRAGGEPGLDMLVKCPDAMPVAAALRTIASGLGPSDRLRIDVDPR